VATAGDAVTVLVPNNGTFNHRATSMRTTMERIPGRRRCRHMTTRIAIMKRAFATLAALGLLGGAALAQSPGSAGSANPSAGTPGASKPGPTNPAGPPAPGFSPPAPSDTTTTGRAPGINPANPQDQTRRGNPQDLTLPGAKNPQDMTR
jgi:hypothetical protein